jgi:hypothetical protein
MKTIVTQSLLALSALAVTGMVFGYLGCIIVSDWIWDRRGRPAPRREHVHRGCTRKYPADFKPTN